MTERRTRGREGEVRAQVKALLEAGRSVREIADELGTSTQNIYRHKAEVVRLNGDVNTFAGDGS